MKHFVKKLLVAACLPILSASAADGGFSLGLVADYVIEDPQSRQDGASLEVDGKTAIGGGLATEFGIHEGVGLEIDLLYLSHRFSRDTADIFGTAISSSFSAGFLHVPVLLRFRPIPLINLGLGVYYSRVLTSWTVNADGFGEQTLNYGKNDFGFVAAVGTLIPITDVFSIVGDLRYTRSLTNTSRLNGDALKFANFQILAGLRFGLR